MKSTFIFFMFFVNISVFAQLQDSLTGQELLQKCINFHDPQGKWDNFRGKLHLVHPKEKDTTTSEVSINLVDDYFNYTATQEGDKVVQQIVDKGVGYYKVNGKKNKASKELIKKYYLGEGQSNFWRNFFMYLYGLPMKLQDKGGIIHEKVYKERFNGEQYLVLKVNYSPDVGKEVWYFYIDPDTYALEAYQFYHNQEDNDGEYILLEGVEVYDGIKIPKTRIWFMNKDDKQIGIDILNKVSAL